MAGIAGILGNDTGELKQMLEKIKYRGPHETWANREGEVNLGCLELNVGGECKDGSHRVSNDKKAVIIDGRVYNSDKGSMTDAEVVLDLYNKVGVQFVEKLDGDFACAISDNNKLILARDWVGIKPLYYGHSDGKLCFASEAKALVGIADDVKEFPPDIFTPGNLVLENIDLKLQRPQNSRIMSKAKR